MTADLAAVAGRFGALLHAAGVPVSPERSGRFAAAVALTRPATTRQLYWAGRVTLVSDPEQIPVFNRVFAHVFGGGADPADWRGDAPPPARVGPSPPGPAPPAGRDQAPRARPPGPPSHPSAPAVVDAWPGGPDGRHQEGPPGLLLASSAEERLRNRDFATLDADELASVVAVARRLVVAAPPRPSRRRVPAHRGAELDLRATLRAARRSGGEPLVQVRRGRRQRRRRLVLLCDISGSMEPYARVYLHLLWSGVGGGRTEAFVFATRLTRLTRALGVRHPDAALERAGRVAPDWSGGTRIGEAIRAFNDHYGRPGMARGAVVVVLSDGWERADPSLLGREMERLRRLSHRVVWVNPRRASDRFQPLTAGMAAALPHVDVLVSGHSLAALDEVVEALGSGRIRPGASRAGR